MKITRFEDIESWQEARLLVKEIYGYFRDCRDFGFKDQVQRAAVSIMSNIAEGFERRGNKEFVHFLSVSRGSLSEVKSLSYAALDVGLLTAEQFESVEKRCNKLNALLNGFIRYLDQSGRKI
jgi:four helix bundle protein